MPVGGVLGPPESGPFLRRVIAHPKNNTEISAKIGMRIGSANFQM